MSDGGTFLQKGQLCFLFSRKDSAGSLFKLLIFFTFKFSKQSLRILWMKNWPSYSLVCSISQGMMEIKTPLANFNSTNLCTRINFRTRCTCVCVCTHTHTYILINLWDVATLYMLLYCLLCQLCLALSDLALQMASWKNAAGELITQWVVVFVFIVNIP